jgi:urea transport system ATP-binding protein
MNGSEGLLQVTDLTVDFDGFKAVNGVDLTFRRGRLHFLIGPNGAGKTTLVDALTGLVGATGRVHFAGRDLLTMKSHHIAASIHRSTARSFLARRRVPARVEEALEVIGLTAQAHRPAGVLAHGQKQWLEVGMLLVQDAQVMFLDETVAGMSVGERDETGDLLQRIVGERTIVVIEHDMEFMRRFADFVTVMHSGKLLAEGTVAEIQADRNVQEVYLGTVTEVAAHG